MEDQKIYQPKLFWQTAPTRTTHCDEMMVACVGIGLDSYLDVYALKDEVLQAEHELLKALTLKPEHIESDTFCFSWALSLTKNGAKISRKGWNGKGMWVQIQKPDVNSKMTLPYLYLNYPDDSNNTPGAMVPWLASQTDLLAEDWVLVK